jgi:hypothetical protein
MRSVAELNRAILNHTCVFLVGARLQPSVPTSLCVVMERLLRGRHLKGYTLKREKMDGLLVLILYVSDSC